MLELKDHELDSEKTYPNTELLYELNKYLEWSGIYNPYEKIYIETKFLKNCAVAIFLLTLSHLSKLVYVKNISTLIGKKPVDHIDGTSFIVGVLTVLKQFHSDVTHSFIEHIARYTTAIADYNLV